MGRKWSKVQGLPAEAFQPSQPKRLLRRSRPGEGGSKVQCCSLKAPARGLDRPRGLAASSLPLKPVAGPNPNGVPSGGLL